MGRTCLDTFEHFELGESCGNVLTFLRVLRISQLCSLKMLPRQHFKDFEVWRRQPTSFEPRGTLRFATHIRVCAPERVIADLT